MPDLREESDQRSFTKKLEHALTVAVQAGAHATLVITSEQSAFLLKLLQLADATGCRISALEESGFHEIGLRARRVVGWLP